jgi:hypothetical protein
MSLLSLGAIHKKDLIFVTGEQKADWFVREGGERVFPRPELVDEYRRASGGRALRLSSLHELLKEMAAPEALVLDIKTAEQNANNEIKAISVRTRIFGTIHTTVKIQEKTFDYSSRDGRLAIEDSGKRFDLAFSKADDKSIYVYRSGSTRRIARVKEAVMDPLSIDQLDTSSDTYTIQLNEGFLVENEAGDILAARIIYVKDDTRGADHDEVKFAYTINDRGKQIFMPPLS